MQFISMDLIREFHPPTTRGKRYALTVICMLTGYVFCIPLKTKTAEEVLQAYVDNMYSKFGGSTKILSDNAFLKACISKHIAPQLEWDDLVPLACAAYNFIPNEHSKESPFFLMFGSDPVLPLNTLLNLK